MTAAAAAPFQSESGATVGEDGYVTKPKIKRERERKRKGRGWG